MGDSSIASTFAYSKPTNMFASEDEEDKAYQEDVNMVKSWWAGPRWRYTRRPYSAEEIVAKRGNLRIEYPSNVQAKKLWKILEERFTVFLYLGTSWNLDLWRQNQDASFTYGCLEPTMLTQMAKYLDTVYVSGWQSSSTASSTDEPSPDLADYPMVSAMRQSCNRRC